MTELRAIREILSELLDVGTQEISRTSYLVRDLGVESIDFLELAVAMNERFRIEVHDDTVFLRNLRLHLAEASEAGAAAPDHLITVYPHLTGERIETILSDLEDGPVIQVRDLERYVQWQMIRTRAA